MKHLKVAKVKAERISKEKSQNVAEELVFAFDKEGYDVARWVQ